MSPDCIIRHLALGSIRCYQLFVSSWLGTHCRFMPSCSCYAAECFHRHSLLDACRFTAKRLLRCHPWGGAGVDPVPPIDGSRS